MLWKRSLHCIRNGILCYGKGAFIALETEFYAMEKELALHSKQNFMWRRFFFALFHPLIAAISYYLEDTHIACIWKTEHYVPDGSIGATQ